MHIIDKIVTAWESTKLARLIRVETDPHPEYSRLDRLDGLR